MSEKEVLKQYWGYDTFRSEQIPIIESIVSKKDTVAVLTTGGGKSICFQVPAMMRDGICLVVSPLIALMKDQVENLSQKGISAATWSGDIQAREKELIIQQATSHRLKFLYISPERLTSKEFQTQIRQWAISMLVIDEAHCISQWGYDFRPSYLEIHKMKSVYPDIQTVALTATANPRVLRDIEDKLALHRPTLFVYSFFKKNFSFQVIHTETKIQKLIEWIQKLRGNGLVYVRRRKQAVEIHKILSQNKIVSDYYHAGLAMDIRNQKQSWWLQNPQAVMVCTNAFGMGIDNPNTNFVIHYEMSDNLESYFQEAGRAGRSGNKAHGIVLYSQADRLEIQKTIEAYPSVMELKNTLSLLFNYYEIPYESGEGFVTDFDIDNFAQKYQISGYRLSLILPLLEENEWIRLEDEYYKPDELKLRMNESELYHWAESKPEYQQLLTHLIRSYEGLWYGRKVNLHAMARKYHYSIDELRAMLQNLTKWEVIDYKPATNKPRIQFLISKYTSENIPMDMEIYTTRKEVYIHQKSSILHYLESKECRQKVLLDYFGEQLEIPCGFCDNDIATYQKQRWSDTDYFHIRDEILKLLTGNDWVSVADIRKHCYLYDDRPIRRVLHRLIELNQIEMKSGELFRKKS